MTAVRKISNPEGSCEICGGTGWRYPEGGAVRCECRAAAAISRHIKAAAIPPRFGVASFENFKTPKPALARALAKAQQYVGTYPCDTGLLFLGPCGTGKTHLAISALKELLRKGVTGLFFDYQELLRQIRESYNPEVKRTELAVLEPVFKADVLVLDELGAERPTEWVEETMTHIIGTRYNQRRPTIFTSNYQDEAMGLYSETLQDRIGVRLRSRLHEMCSLVLIEGDDYRKNPGLRRVK